MGDENSPLQGSDPRSVQPVARRYGGSFQSVGRTTLLPYSCYSIGGLPSLSSDLLNLTSCVGNFGKTWSARKQHEETRHNSMLK